MVIDSYDVSGYYDSDGKIDEEYSYVWEENDRELEITEWFDTDGHAVFNSAQFNLSHFTKIFDLADDKVKAINLQDENEWGQHVNEELDGYTGNEGVNKTTTYSKYVLVMWPQRIELAVMLRMNPQCAIDSFFNSFVKINQPMDQKARENFTAIIDHVIRGKKIHEDQVIKIYQLLVKFNDASLVEKFLSQVNQTLTLANSSELATLINNFGHELLRPSLDSIVSRAKNLAAVCNLILVKV